MEIAISIVIWTLAFYGLFEIIKNIINIYTYTKLKTNGIYLVVAVKNQEQNIEYFLRNLLFKILYGKEEIQNIIVVDLNSEDDTKMIIDNIQRDYEKISVLTLKECKELFENINV